ncbi:MAG: phosphopantetheine-binding protein [Bacteroidota bacterium]
MQNRKISLNERLYQIGEELAPPFALQFVVKGKGTLETTDLQDAIQRLADQLPVMRARMEHRHWHFDEALPKVVEYDQPVPKDWNDVFFHAKVEGGMRFHLFSDGLVFRVLHRLVDAKGAQLILTALFQFMRGESIEVDSRFPSDEEVRKKLVGTNAPYREGYLLNQASLSLREGNDLSCRFAVFSSEKILQALLAKSAVWFSRHLNAPVRMLIPVDIRRHEGVPAAAANLSLPIYLHTDPGQDWNEVQADLLQSLANKAELAAERFAAFGTLAPKRVVRQLMRLTIRQAAKKNRFPMSGFLSDNGTMRLADVSTPTFEAQDIVSLPVFVPMAPFCLVALHHEAGSRIAIAVPKHMEVEKLISQLADFWRKAEPETEKTDRELKPLQSSLELDLQEIWADILECDKSDIDADSRFQGLGGDSLNLLSMVSEVIDVYFDGSESAFMSEVLSTGGQLTIPQLIGMMERYSNQNMSLP